MVGRERDAYLQFVVMIVTLSLDFSFLGFIRLAFLLIS